MNKFLYTLLVVLIASVSVAQKKTDPLLEIDGKPVTAKEFKQVYQKNLDLVQLEDQKSVDSYLKLFTDFRLKVAEAYAQELHEKPSFKKDFQEYKAQLTTKFIAAEKVTEDLVQEAYERGKYQINASHILIKCEWGAFSADTLAAYNKIAKIREIALSGVDFDSLVQVTSEEPNAKESKGNLGYFSAFGMVYPFETAAYNTPVGEISEIVRTRYGYHILKVNDRRNKPNPIQVSHIMISNKANEEATQNEEAINEIYSFLNQGQAFEDLAKQYSDDKNSGANGGKLNPFSKGELRAPAFEDAAYDLKSIGEVSKPFQSKFGWHVIRLDSLLMAPSLEEQQESLQRAVKRGRRNKVVTTNITQRIKDEFNYQSNNAYFDYFRDIVTDTILKRSWKYDANLVPDDIMIIKIEDEVYSYRDFANFLLKEQTVMPRYTETGDAIRNLFDKYEDVLLKDKLHRHLLATNDEYAALIKEYKEGLLIFEVMGQNVWDYAKNDTIGQQNYFEKNRSNYTWGERVEAHVFSAPDKNTLALVKEQLAQGMEAQAIKDTLDTEGQTKVILNSGTYEYNARQLPKDYTPSLGVSEVYEQNGLFFMVQTNKMLPPGLKEFEETKGRVIGDYQNEVETNWIQSLRDKYEVSVNKRALKKLKKELRS